MAGINSQTGVGTGFPDLSPDIASCVCHRRSGDAQIGHQSLLLV